MRRIRTSLRFAVTFHHHQSGHRTKHDFVHKAALTGLLPVLGLSRRIGWAIVAWLLLLLHVLLWHRVRNVEVCLQAILRHSRHLPGSDSPGW